LKGPSRGKFGVPIREVFAGNSSLPDEVAAKLADSLAHLQTVRTELQVLDRWRSVKQQGDWTTTLYQRIHGKEPRKICFEKAERLGRTEAIATAYERGLIKTP